MDAALELPRARPAPGALVLARADRTGARDAADRGVARVVQRVVRNLVDREVRRDALGVPVDERLDLPDVVALGVLDLLGVRARGGLLAADAGDPGLVRLERLHERLDLADVAAAVGIRLPQVRPLGDRLLGERVARRHGLELEAVPRDEPVPRLVRLLEEDLRVQLDDVDLEAELADHVHECRRLALPRAGEAHAVAEALVRPQEHILGGHRLEVRRKQAGGRQAAPPSACPRAGPAAASRAGLLPRAGCCPGSRTGRSASRTTPGRPSWAPRRSD